MIQRVDHLEMISSFEIRSILIGYLTETSLMMNKISKDETYLCLIMAMTMEDM